MLCPVCKVTLVMTDRQGIEIDYCPQCRGVWLDRGELDKLIERGDRVRAAPSSEVREGYRDDERHQGKYRKRKSLFGDLFDF
jgi:uncharacterized protein